MSAIIIAGCNWRWRRRSLWFGIEELLEHVVIAMLTARYVEVFEVSFSMGGARKLDIFKITCLFHQATATTLRLNF